MRAIDGNSLAEKVEQAYKSATGDDRTTLSYVLDLIADAPTITQPSEWVSVEDRLPDTAGEFLVVYHPCYGDKVTSEIRVGIDSFRGKTTWAKRKYQRVTHWMPLPEPPKGE